jgi:hypothetical protein
LRSWFTYHRNIHLSQAILQKKKEREQKIKQKLGLIKKYCNRSGENFNLANLNINVQYIRPPSVLGYAPNLTQELYSGMGAVAQLYTANLSIPVLRLDIVSECFWFLVAVMIMSIYEERQL